MIVDASLVIDAVADPAERGAIARAALGAVPAAEPLLAPGQFAFEVMSGLRAWASRAGHGLDSSQVRHALDDAAAMGIVIEATQWTDVQRAWVLAQGSLSLADSLYVATAERHRTALLTADARIERSGVSLRCQVITLRPLDRT